MPDDPHPTMREYQFPLRPDCTATLWLPKDLRKSEIVRLTALMEALVMIEEVEKRR